MRPDGDIILITGANGRIGTAVMRELRKTFSNVVGFDLQSPPDPPEGCTRIPVDITSDDRVTEGHPSCPSRRPRRLGDPSGRILRFHR